MACVVRQNNTYKLRYIRSSGFFRVLAVVVFILVIKVFSFCEHGHCEFMSPSECCNQTLNKAPVESDDYINDIVCDSPVVQGFILPEICFYPEDTRITDIPYRPPDPLLTTASLLRAPPSPLVS